MTKTYKLIQMNVWHWRLYWPMRRFLERERPDFICAQEAVDAASYQMADHYTTSGIVAEKLMAHKVQAPGKLHDICNGEERRIGNAILGQQALEQAGIIPIADPDTPNAPYFQLLHVTTEVNGQTLHLLTYHGRLGVDISGNGTAVDGEGLRVPGTPRLGSIATEADFAKIAAYIDRLSGPVVLTGDFNLWANAEALRPLKTRLTNLVETHKIISARNQLAWKTDEAVSHVFVSPEIKVESFSVAPDLVSDHQPLVLEFTIGPV